MLLHERLFDVFTLNAKCDIQSKKRNIIDVYLQHDSTQIWQQQTYTYTNSRRCGPTNLIVDDSDFKPSKFDHRFWSDSDSNDHINDSNFDLILIYFGLKSMVFYLFFIKRSIKVD